MNKPESGVIGADWTKFLSDPDIASHLGELLRAYREAPPEKRDRALLDAMRKIKAEHAGPSTDAAAPIPEIPVTPAVVTPPFEPSFTPIVPTDDRRRDPRMKTFVAVELRVHGSSAPVWGNLANTSRGGCFVETATMVPNGEELEIGLWLANGKIWVKGMILNGVVTKSNSFGLRIKFAEMGMAERERLREFLKFVENSTRGYQSRHGYLAQIKR